MKIVVWGMVWVLALAAVWEKVDVYRTGYAIERLRVQKKQLQQEQRVLAIELAKITAPDNIERVATTRLGMVRPRYDQVVLVGPRPKSPMQGIIPVVHRE